VVDRVCGGVFRVKPEKHPHIFPLPREILKTQETKCDACRLTDGPAIFICRTQGVILRRYHYTIKNGSGCEVSDEAFHRSTPRVCFAKRMERDVTYFLPLPKKLPAKIEMLNICSPPRQVPFFSGVILIFPKTTTPTTQDRGTLCQGGKIGLDGERSYFSYSETGW